MGGNFINFFEKYYENSNQGTERLKSKKERVPFRSFKNFTRSVRSVPKFWGTRSRPFRNGNGTEERTFRNGTMETLDKRRNLSIKVHRLLSLKAAPFQPLQAKMSFKYGNIAVKNKTISGFNPSKLREILYEHRKSCERKHINETTEMKKI